MVEGQFTDPPAGAEAVPDPAGRALPPLPARLVRVFTSPGDLFERLRERPAWVGVLLVIIVVNAVASLLIPADLLREMMAANMPPDADPAALEGAMGFARITGVVGSIVIPVIVVAALAGILILVYNVMLGGEATYRQLFAAAGHAFWISVVGGVLTLGLMVASGDVQTALAFHLLAPGLEEGYVYRLLHGLNVFGLWTAVALGIAVSRIYPRRGAGSAAILLVALYVVFKAVVAAFDFGPA